MTAIAEQRGTRSPFPQAKVVDVRFDVCNYADVVAWLKSRVACDNRCCDYVCVSNVTDVMDARRDADYRDALAGSSLTVPDGAPIVWALRDYGYDISERVYGPTLMQSALEDAEVAAARHVLMAGSPQAREGMRRKFRLVNWVDEIDFRYDKLGDDDLAAVANQLRDIECDIAWISLGGGKQVRFMNRLAPLVGRGTLIGVGAAFDFHAGTLAQAPGWMQRNGLEWLFRLSTEPRRLWHRYLVHNPPYLWHWLRERRRMRANARVPA